MNKSPNHIRLLKMEIPEIGTSSVVKEHHLPAASTRALRSLVCSSRPVPSCRGPKPLQTTSLHPAHPLCLNADPTACGLWPGRGNFCSPDTLPAEPSVVPRCSESRVCPLMRAADKRCSFSVLSSRKSSKIVGFSKFFPCSQ